MLTIREMEAGLDLIRRSPQGTGRVEMIVRRPQIGAREVITEATLDTHVGLVGDNWLARGYRRTADGSAHPDMQLTLMNARAIALVAQTKDRWALAGDQLFVDFDLSDAHIPPGTQLRIGTALVEVTAEPHTGCRQFAARFGKDAVKFVNSPIGKHLHLRGINAKIIRSGRFCLGDTISKTDS
jgi:MOSC domain-containing protein YiiM